MAEGTPQTERQAKTLIRPYRPSDLDALIEVTVRTGNAGGDASGLHGDDELLAYVYMAPYVALAPEWAWVAEKDGRPVGFLVAVPEAAEFDIWWLREWAPVMDEKFPAEERAVWPEPGQQLFEAVQAGRAPSVGTNLPELGEELSGDSQQQDIYPAELHINLLPEAQGLGAGRRLMETLFEKLRDEGAPGITLGVDPNNEQAVGFYKHLGFNTVRELRDESGQPVSFVMTKRVGPA